MKAILYSCICVLLISFSFQQGFSQDKTISGKVTDAGDGEALPGVSVVVKNTTIGVATDVNGAYTLTVPGSAKTLVFSFVGYQDKEMPINQDGGTTLSISASMEQSSIYLDLVTVSVSRREEKVLNAPASISIIEGSEIETNIAISPSDHLNGVAGVDVVKTGIMASNIVTRGFNSVFSGKLLTLCDNRIASVPSLRINAYQMIPGSLYDFERIEVVKGPGSALYGPNSAGGILHYITKSPLDMDDNYQTIVSVAGGERSVLMGSLRTAGKLMDKSAESGMQIGYKISGSYMSGNDFEYVDVAEPDSIIFGIQTSGGRKAPDGTDLDGTQPLVANDRDYDVENYNIDGRLDIRFNKNTEVILSGGYNNFSGIELTGLGAAQGVNWGYSYVQARFRHNSLFVQGYMNTSNAGDTYLLRSGDLIVDNSKFTVFQIQHGYSPIDKLQLTYGADALLTRPDTKGTINGLNEDDDSINEIGGYLQADFSISEKLSLIGAARLDDHSFVEDIFVSPRAALVFKPSPLHNLRATYNRAFDSPNNIFSSLDVLSESDAYGFQAAGLPSGIDIRGAGNRGFYFSRNNGVLQFRTPFAPLVLGTPADFYDLGDPLITNAVWGVAKAGVGQELASNGVPQATVDNLTNNIVPGTITEVVNHSLLMLNVSDPLNPFDPTKILDPDSILDIAPIKNSVTQTIEIGYKGIVTEKLSFAIDLYRTEISDFISPLTVQTPNVFLNSTDLANYGSSLATQIGTALAQPVNAVDNAILIAALDAIPNGGNGNGSAVDELTAIYIGAAAQIPFGTVNNTTANDPSVILTYSNFGDVTVYGVDLSVNYYVNDNFRLGLTYSLVDKDRFEVQGEPNSYIALNSPKNKIAASANYEIEKIGLNVGVRFRWQDDFPVRSGVYIGRVDAFYSVDLSLGYNLPFSENTRVSVNVQNLTDNLHNEFIGSPKIGRLGLIRLAHIF